jgi:hypothetical protein
VNTGRPRLELLAAPGTGERVVPLVRVLARWWEPAAADAALGAPVAVLATSPHARGLADRLGGEIPTAVWVGPHESIDGLPAAPTMVLAPEPVDVPDGVTVVRVPVPGLDGDDHRPLSPFVRERWRRRLDLPAHLVVSVGFPHSPVLDDDTVGTALAVAAAVAARGDVVLRAMALGAPVATDSATAHRLGLGDGVVVADDPEAAAIELAAHPIAAAALSRQARAEIEAHHDLTAAARAIRDCADSARRPGPNSAISGLEERLRELGTPRYSVPARRAAAAVVDLPGLVGS